MMEPQSEDGPERRARHVKEAIRYLVIARANPRDSID